MVRVPLHVRGVDVLGGVERKRRRRVDHEVHAFHRLVHDGRVPDVAFYSLYVVFLGVVELFNVERGQPVSAGAQVPDQVYPQKPGPAGNEDFLSALLALIIHR